MSNRFIDEFTDKIILHGSAKYNYTKTIQCDSILYYQILSLSYWRNLLSYLRLWGGIFRYYFSHASLRAFTNFPVKPTHFPGINEQTTTLLRVKGVL